MKKKPHPVTRSVVVLSSSLVMILVIGLACNTPGGGGAPATEAAAGAIHTAAAQTVRAELTLENTAQAPPETVTGVPATNTPIPEGPTNTPTPQASETPTFTPTLAIPIIRADANTNCRRGPSKLYDPPVGALLKGQESEVYGVNDARTWWYIAHPENVGNYCWVWTDTTRVEGNVNNLPVITPPPLPPTATFTPTPGVVFTASYQEVHDCSGNPTAIFKIVNSGGLALESMRLEIKDLTDSDTLFGPDTSNAPFMGTADECPPGGDVLNPGKTFYVGGAIGAGNAGHDAQAKIRLCTEDDLDGTCADKTVNFDIP